MAEDQQGEVPVRQDVAADGDLYAAGRDMRVSETPVSGSRGVQVGDNGRQWNIFLSGEGGAAPGAAAGGVAAGRPLGEVTDPFDLEVHRALEAGEAIPGLGVLPAYLPRDHDRALAEVAGAAAGGRSGIGVLVGGSSTGKTRACWEALEPLRGRDQPWRLWHPVGPGHPEAVERGLAGVGPQTVVWLNEAQFYLLTGDGSGERVAAGLRELLRDKDRAPVLVLATLWPEYWED